MLKNMKTKILLICLVVAIVLLSGCLQPPSCGNLQIDEGENCSNCPTDVQCAADETCENGVCTRIVECKGEGETIPFIADPPECCEGLELILPKEENTVGISGTCTAKCGNGECDRETESNYNCPEDCQNIIFINEPPQIPPSDNPDNLLVDASKDQFFRDKDMVFLGEIVNLEEDLPVGKDWNKREQYEVKIDMVYLNLWNFPTDGTIKSEIVGWIPPKKGPVYFWGEKRGSDFIMSYISANPREIWFSPFSGRYKIEIVNLVEGDTACTSEPEYPNSFCFTQYLVTGKVLDTQQGLVVQPERTIEFYYDNVEFEVGDTETFVGVIGNNAEDSELLIYTCIEGWNIKNFVPDEDYAMGEILIGFGENVDEANARAIIESYGLTVKEVINLSFEILITVGVEPNTEFEWICTLEEDDRIEYAEPNYIVYAQ